MVVWWRYGVMVLTGVWGTGIFEALSYADQATWLSAQSDVSMSGQGTGSAITSCLIG